MNNQKRIIGIDAIKLIACIFIVAVHTINGSLGIFNRILSLLCVFCMPLFFICSGYTMFMKEKLTYDYVIKKVCRILLICLSWEALHAFAYWIYYHEVRNFIESFFLDFLQKGLFYHFWFMGALILMYILIPLLKNMYEKNASLYKKVLIFIICINVVIDLSTYILGRQYFLDIPQTLRVWFWIMYVMLGGLLFKEGESYLERIKKYKYIFLVLLLVGSVIWQEVMSKNFLSSAGIEGFFGSILIIVGTIVLLLIFQDIKVNKIMEKIITIGVSLMMGIYIMHPFILAVLVHFFPIFKMNEVWNFIYWIITFLISTVISFIVSKLPVVKNLIKL